MSKLGENIKKLRLQKGISQDKLSKLADMSANTIAKLEIDPEPNPRIIRNLAGITSHHLVCSCHVNT